MKQKLNLKEIKRENRWIALRLMIQIKILKSRLKCKTCCARRNKIIGIEKRQAMIEQLKKEYKVIKITKFYYDNGLNMNGV